MRILIDHDGVVVVETHHLLMNYHVIEFVQKERGGNWLMMLFEQENPYRAENGRWNYVLREEPTK